ncbi:hypothetical protein H4Q26_016608 [Puccinia striiformis f. sp. tritici PST-130]|nr:hypothetical protein H4Q26_016608 [Puccinia striiformis f. sp. tritici PST-130]
MRFAAEPEFDPNRTRRSLGVPKSGRTGASGTAVPPEFGNDNACSQLPPEPARNLDRSDRTRQEQLVIPQEKGQDERLQSLSCHSSDNLPPGATVESTVREAVRAGVKIVQLREKNLSTRLFLERARALREICQPPVKLIINDRIDIAHACGADGVHLGQDDMPLLDAQKIFRVGEIIGISVNTIDEALAAVKAGADYLGVGTCWATGTKSIPPHKIMVWPRGVKAIRDELDRLNLSTPLVVIGGINSTNLIRTLYGCTSNQFYYARRAESPIGVAVVSAIMSSPDPYRATQKLQNMIQEFEAWLRTPEGPFLDPDVT